MYVIILGYACTYAFTSSYRASTLMEKVYINVSMLQICYCYVLMKVLHYSTYVI